MYALFLIGWALSTLGLIANLVLGFILTRSMESSSSLHLLLALFSLTLGVICHFLLMKESQRLLEAASLRLANQKDRSEILRMSQKKALASGLMSLAFIVVSLITGTISHAGKFPFIHAILGLLVVGFSVQTLILWIKYQLKTASL